MIAAGEIKYLAGLLEGEGSFSFHGGTPVIAFGTTDRDVIDRARDLLGHHGVTSTRAATARWKQMFQIFLCGESAAGWMMTLYVLMGWRRKTAIASALRRWRTAAVANSKKKMCPRGHQYDLKKMRHGGRGLSRGCNICSTDRKRAARANGRTEPVSR